MSSSALVLGVPEMLFSSVFYLCFFICSRRLTPRGKPYPWPLMGGPIEWLLDALGLTFILQTVESPDLGDAR